MPFSSDTPESAAKVITRSWDSYDRRESAFAPTRRWHRGAEDKRTLPKSS